ncbi:MAG: translation elongation factor Ts [Gammaproteobacteria bacterium]|nr:translation elongation factor Ts [Gammaproteobacteria bacterium]
MSITAAMVKELRERTGSGMMECKNALVEANGDMDAAIEQMRKSGLAKADKKSDRTAAEGTITIKVSDSGQQAVIIEINCETDFVGNGDDFRQFSDNVADIALNTGVASIEELLTQTMGDVTVEDARKALIAKIGENINIRRLHRMDSEQGSIFQYLHGSRIGVIVDIAGVDQDNGKGIAMHVAASNPVCISDDQVDPALLEKEREIFSAQADASGKPAEIIEKMVAGRLKKFLKEITLLGQPYIKDPDVSVAQLLSKLNGSVSSFQRFEVGEGIEKVKENFAEEVMAQVKSV